MKDEEIRDAHYWGSRLREDETKLDETSKLNLIRGLLLHTTSLELQEVDLFLKPSKITDPEALMRYSVVEGKIADIYGSCHPENWDERQQYLDFIRDCLSGFYTSKELDEIETLILTTRDANTITVWLAGDHYGIRRIRNAYLHKITDFISIDMGTGESQDLTKELFAEGSEDAVSRIERVLEE